MTREKIKSEVVNLIQESTYQTELNLLAFIDELCDDFESRICENCKHRRESKTLIRWGCAFLVKEDSDLGNSLNFGCTKFERKEQ